jgi:hypothetical protein
MKSNFASKRDLLVAYRKSAREILELWEDHVSLMEEHKALRREHNDLLCAHRALVMLIRRLKVVPEDEYEWLTAVLQDAMQKNASGTPDSPRIDNSPGRRSSQRPRGRKRRD